MNDDTDSGNSPYHNEERFIQPLVKESDDFNTNLYLALQKMNTTINAKQDDIYSSIETAISRHFLPIYGRYDDKNATYRQLYRVTIDMGNMTAGQTKSMPHNIEMSGRMAVIKLWAAATQTKENGWTFGREISHPNVTIDDTNIMVGSDKNYDHCFATVEFIRVLQKENE